MKKFIVKLYYETKIEAYNEEDAKQKFFEDYVYDIQSNADTFIDGNLTIKKID